MDCTLCERIQKNIIIVTRDSDYGETFKKESFLNDWLDQEFKQRVSRKRKIKLTDTLYSAFEMLSVNVTPEMIAEEQRIISEQEKKPFTSEEVREILKELSEQNDANTIQHL